MALNRLTNLIATRNGRMLYVNSDDFNASDLISNNGNSPTRPFKTIQRALLEVARFSYVTGQNNDKYDQFTISLSPGDYVIDNRHGKPNSAEVAELSDQSNFDLLDPNNDLYKFNAVGGGLVIPRGTSIVGMDLRKTRIRPRYVPDPADSSVAKTSIFNVTGACYFWQFSLFDALPTSDSSGQGGVYNTPSSTSVVNSNYSHHKVTCFTYADQSDLDLFYAKAARAFASIPTSPGELESRIQETRIVGPLQQSGQQGISTVGISGSLVTVVTSGPHEVFEGQQITIEDITGSYSSLNGSYYVTSVTNDSELIITVPGLIAGTIPSNDLTNAIVKAEVDTVDSSSPYIFNCSLRSTYGLCGLWADGNKVTGFKSMVVAQFTGVSLQKDDRAFVKFTETTSPNPSFVLEGGSSDAISLHQDSAGYVYYRGDATDGWRSNHIRVSNNAFIQSVSVFAVGYSEQHLIEAGGDYSITNSNSNFGTMALCADGFRPDSFTLDKKGYFSHIVPPQSLGTQETDVPYYPLDVQKSRDGITANGVGSRLYLFEQTDPNRTPVFDINQYKIGGRVSDKIFANLTDPTTSQIQEYQASISPNGIEEHVISAVSTATDIFSTASTNNFETATPIRIYSSTGYLPLGMESNRLYYAIKVTNTSFKIAPSEEDARAGAGGAANSIVNIRSQIPGGASLSVKAYVSDTNPELPRFNVIVNANDETISTGTFPHGFTTGDKVFFNRSVISGQVQTGALPLIQAGGTVTSLSLSTEYYVYVVDSFTFKIADSESNANNNVPIPIDTNGDASVLTVYRNIQKSPLRYDPVHKAGSTVGNWYIAVTADITNTIHPILTSNVANNIYSNPSLSNTENVFLRRLSDNRGLSDRTYRMRYVIPKTELNARPPLIGYVVKRKTDATNAVIPYNTANASDQTADFNRVYFIYRSDTILTHIPGEQDGIYYLTILIADVAPKGSQFNSPTDTFGFLAYSQDVGNIYPDLDKDNPQADPPAAVSVADNLIHGLVYQDDNRSSLTKESIQSFVNESGYAATLASQTGKAVSGQENRLIPFSGTLPQIGVELRRTSQVRAGNQTFEYTGFGSGNYSTAFPSKQERVLNDKEVLYSQAQRRRAGIVFYSGLNAYGDLYVGNQKINAVTGEVEILDKPILRVAGSTATVNDEYVPYVSGTKNVNIEGTLVTGGGANQTANGFNNESLFNEGIQVSTKDPTAVNRAFTTHDVNYRPKGLALASAFSNATVKQTALLNSNLRPNPGVEGVFLGDAYFKNTISTDTRHEGYIYVGSDSNGNFLNGGWRQLGLVGVGHLTSIEETYNTTGGGFHIEPYEVTGKFGINQDNPTESLHVGTGDVLFDNNLEVGIDGVIQGDLAINGGDLTSTSPIFNYTTTSTEVNFSTSATTLNVAASDAANGPGTSGGTSVTTLLSDNLVIKSDVEFSGKYDTGTSGSKTFNATVTAEVANFMTTPNTVNFATQTINAFTGATNLNIAASTGLTQVNNDLKVIGNFSVQGTTTTVNSTVTTIQDPVITLGGGVDNADLSSDDNKDRGLELKYYEGSSKLAFIGWDNSASEFALLYDATNSSEQFSGTGARLNVGSITINTDGGSNFINYEPDPYTPFDTTDVSVNFQRLIGKYAVPTGTIVMFSGTTAPEGWVLCHGGDATSRSGSTVTIPDLRDKFIVGTGSSYALAGTGGAVSHSINQLTWDNNVTPQVSDNITITVDDHALQVGEIPQHKHGMGHTHSNVTAALPAHAHTYSDKFLSDSGEGDYDNEESSKQDGQYHYEEKTTGQSPAASAAVTFGAATDTSPNTTGMGGQQGLSGSGHNHPSSKSGGVTISDTTHQHNMNFTIPTLPPYYALAFIYKL
jgi:hypothetical protein